MDSGESRHLKPAALGYAALGLGLLAGLYRGVLDLWFTGGDTFALIESSRVKSGVDLARLLSERLMAGTGFYMDYYRPVTSLTFALDYRIWGLDPFGYHLTDLVLQGLACLALFLFLRALCGTHAAGIGTILFVTHPLLTEVVPVIARRQDVLAGLFLFLSLWVFVRARGDPSRAETVLSGGLFLLALAAKESAVIMVVFPFAYAVLLPSDPTADTKDRLRRALGRTIPYLLVTVLFWGLRTAILGTARGGRLYTASAARLWGNRVRGTLRVGEDLFAFLRFPEWTVVQAAGTLLLLGLLVLWVHRKWCSEERGIPDLAAVLLWLGVGLAIGVVLLYPFYEPVVRGILGRAYHGRGSAFLSDLMTGRAHTSLEAYVTRFRAYWLGGWLLTGGLLACLARGGALARMVRDPSRHSRANRKAALLLVVMGVWLAVLVYLAEFTGRNLYVPVGLLSGLLSLGIVEGGAAAWRGAKPPFSPSVLPGLVSIVLVAWTWFYSPLFHPYRGWECAGRTASSFLNQLPAHVDLARTRTLHVRNYPPEAVRFPGPSVRSVSRVSPYSVVSWYRLNGRETALDSVEFTVGPRLESCPDSPDDWAWSVESKPRRTEVSIRWFP